MIIIVKIHADPLLSIKSLNSHGKLAKIPERRFLRVSLTRRLIRRLRATRKFSRGLGPRVKSYPCAAREGRKKGRRHIWLIRGNRARSKYPARILPFSTRFAVEPQESHEEVRNNARQRRSVAREKERRKKRKREREKKEPLIRSNNTRVPE